MIASTYVAAIKACYLGAATTTAAALGLLEGIGLKTGDLVVLAVVFVGGAAALRTKLGEYWKRRAEELETEVKNLHDERTHLQAKLAALEARPDLDALHRLIADQTGLIAQVAKQLSHGEQVAVALARQLGVDLDGIRPSA